MKKWIIAALLFLGGSSLYAQESKAGAGLYNPAADANADIRQAVKQAQQQHKNVLLMIGGNWCIWCTRFNQTVTGNDTLSKLMKDNYVLVHVNYEKKNAEDKLWGKLGYPQRFGFPVFVILDDKGNRIHTQNSGYLEEGKGHSPAKIAEFLQQWSPAAVAGQTLK